MWDDLCESYETNAASYFLGSIIVTPVKASILMLLTDNKELQH